MAALGTMLGRAGRSLGDLAFAGGDLPAPAQHLPSGRELRRYMVTCTVAVLPAFFLALVYLGDRVLLTFAVAFAAGRAVELATAALRRRRSRGGSLTIALLLALVLPAGTPWWLVLPGAAFGVFFGKEVFGGTGHNVFNPVLIGQAFLVVSFPDVVTGGSFAAMSEGATARLFGVALTGGEACVGAILLAGAALLIARAVDWRITVSVLASATASVLALRALGLGDLPQPHAFLLSGGFLMGACVLAGDPATSPGVRGGRWAYGALVGLIAAVVCGFTANAEFMMYAVLLGNLAAPTIDAAALAVREGRAAA